MEKKPRKVKLLNCYSIEIVGSSENPVLKFQGMTKNDQPYSIEVNLDDFDVRQLIEQSIKHFARVEETATNRLRQFRKTMNYTNSEPKINYI